MQSTDRPTLQSKHDGAETMQAADDGEVGQQRGWRMVTSAMDGA